MKLYNNVLTNSGKTLFLLNGEVRLNDLVIYLCISESFNPNIKYHFFYYKITIVKSQHKPTNSKDYFVLKIRF